MPGKDAEPISEQDVRYVARLARLALSEEEYRQMTRQLGEIIEYVGKLGELDTEGVEPLAFAATSGGVFREDKSRGAYGAGEMLSGAPAAGDGCYLVPKVIE